MNERIEELLIKAIKEVGPDDTDNGAKEKTLEKFAELIIKKCTNILPEDSIRNKDGVHMYYVIREYFGVDLIRGENEQD